jgi:CDP-glucose 4,6-dehydratase
MDGNSSEWSRFDKMDLRQHFEGRKVWVSGHTGFKGSWLCEWLLMLGAKVHGFALPPHTVPSMFEQIDLGRRLAMDETGDIRNRKQVRGSILSCQPDYVFHLAAQAIVRESYASPVETWETNVLGTINVLEAIRELSKPCAAVMVTSDKCYEPQEWVYGYRETDPLGGSDPYSSSKAAAEIAIASWRRSFFPQGNHPVKIASVRAGNVIGGGDWATDRLVPDYVRSLGQKSTPLRMRNPDAVRPWQHVLDPLHGYLMLAAQMTGDSDLQTAFNFGPGPLSHRTVEALVKEMFAQVPKTVVHHPSLREYGKESKFLALSSDKAHRLLGWFPKWNFETAVARTMQWYLLEQDLPGETARMLRRTRHQIEEFEKCRNNS